VRRKSLSCPTKRASVLGGLIAAGLSLVGWPLPGAEIISTNRFLGTATCSSSGCHGGGGPTQNQFLVWSLRDVHAQRPAATLTTARSKQIADALQINDPAADLRCTTCHAPLQAVPIASRGEAFSASESVSCESCHGPAENWLRSHTRPDYTHADRTVAGLRDLKNLYVRANTCVACHQTVATALLQAGHPELIFELDGQSVAQPKHWRESADTSGAQMWFIGQAIALRELSWQLAGEPAPNEKLAARWSALLWLLQKLDGLGPEFSTLSGLSAETNAQNLRATLTVIDELAKRIAGNPWTDEMSRRALATLSATADDFQRPGLAMNYQARRAERLVLALDRLLSSRRNLPPNREADANLNRLFRLAQSLPEFNTMAFAEALNAFSKSLGP